MRDTKTHRLIYLGTVVLSVTIAACAAQTSPKFHVGSGVWSDRTLREEDTSETEATLHVAAAGFTLAMEASRVNAGTVTFSVRNDASIPHDFAIQGNGVDRKTSILQPGETASLTVDLLPGTYTYKCTVHFHHLLGMKGTLTVVGSEPQALRGRTAAHHFGAA